MGSLQSLFLVPGFGGEWKSLWSPVVRQEDLLGAGEQSSVADDRFTGFLVPWEWD